MPKTTIDDDLVRQLADLLDEKNLTEIEYSTGQLRVKVARGGVAMAPVAGLAAAPVPLAEAAGSASEAPVAGSVTSPMVGTAYLAPEPGAANFVAVGDRVSEGQTLLLIEAMKTFNEVRAPRAGEVKRILIENATPVEYGDVLMIIE